MESKYRSESFNDGRTGLSRQRIAGRPDWIPRINTNGVYTYYPTYAETLVAYNKPTIMPVLFLEENYETRATRRTPNVLRQQGIGRWVVARWLDTCTEVLDGQVCQWLAITPEHTSVTELGYFKNFFNSISLVRSCAGPTHTFLTGMDTGHSTHGHVGDHDYATGLRSAGWYARSRLHSCFPYFDHCNGQFCGPVTARWYDPTSAHVPNISGSPFPNSGSHNFATPGNNSAGDPDWVLLLQAASGSPTPTPTATATFTPTPTSTANTAATATATATATVTPTATATATATAASSPILLRLRLHQQLQQPAPTVTPTATAYSNIDTYATPRQGLAQRRGLSRRFAADSCACAIRTSR